MGFYALLVGYEAIYVGERACRPDKRIIAPLVTSCASNQYSRCR